MPRDANGNYTLPSGNPVISGTTIDTSWANPTMSDLANEITNSLSRTGEGGMLVPFQNIDGAVGTPGITWRNETVSGFYRQASGDMRVSVGGVDKFRWTASAVQVWDTTELIWKDVLVDGDLPDSIVQSFNTRVGHVVSVAGDYDANIVNYDNASSGLVATQVQAAIDEIDATVTAIDSDYVSSFNTRNGAVVPVAGDYLAAQVNTAPFNTLTATEVQTALEQLEGLVEFLGSGVVLKGTWDAALNVPDLLTIAKASGNYWVVSVAGTTPLPDGEGGFIDDWGVGDKAFYINQVTPTIFVGWVKVVTSDTLPATNVTFDSAIFDDFFAAPFPTQVQAALDFGWPLLALAETSLQPGDNVSELVNDAGYLIAASAVTSFKARIGAVVPVAGDYSASLISYSNATSGLTATQVQAAIDELDGLLDDIGTNVVTTFNTRVGDVLSQHGDYVANQIIYDNTGSDLVAIEVQAAIDELDAKSGVVSFNTRTGAVLPVAGDYTAIEVDYDNALTPAWSVTEVQSALVDAYDAIQFLAGSVVLKGTWDALANVPDLVVIGKTSGNYWIVSVEGSTVLPLYPGSPAFVLPYEVSDRILWIDDGAGSSGFAQLRPDVSDYLLLTGGSMLGQIVGVSPGPVAAGDLTRKDYVDNAVSAYLLLAGGTMTGDITGSNGLSYNTVTSNADSGNIGKETIPKTLDADIINKIGFYHVDSTATGNPYQGNRTLIFHNQGSSAGESAQIAFGIGMTGQAFRTQLSGVWTDWVLVATTTDLAAYLPLTGGRLSGRLTIEKDGESLTLKPVTGTNASYIQFDDGNDVLLGYVGRVGAGNTMAMNAAIGEIELNAATTIDLNAPAIEANGHVNLRGDTLAVWGVDTGLGARGVIKQISSTDGNPLYPSNAYNIDATFSSGGNIILFSLASSTTTKVRITTTGILADQDITAFSGGANEIAMSTLGASNVGDISPLNNADVNTYVNNGYNYASNTALNTPLGDYAFIHTIAGDSTSNTAQIAVDLNSDRMFFRRNRSNVWQPWFELATTATASKAGVTGLISGGINAIVTFATPFPDANYAATCSYDGTGNVAAPTIVSKTATQLTIRNNSGSQFTINWIATPFNS